MKLTKQQTLVNLVLRAKAIWNHINDNDQKVIADQLTEKEPDMEIIENIVNNAQYEINQKKTCN